MGKNKEKSAAKAAEQAAAQQAAPEQKKTVEVIQAGDLLNAAKTGGQSLGLSPDATVMALNGLKTMVHDNPNAAEYYGLGEEGVKKINHFTLAGFATVLAIECMQRKSEFAVRMLEKQPEALNAIAEYTGVTIDAKLLPKPKEDGTIEVPSSAVKITKEAEKGIKEEIAATEKEVITDPTKIENESQLKDSLLKLLLKGNGSENFYDKVNTAINFYESYLSIQASKSDNKEEALAELKKKSRYDFLTDIANLLGKCPFSVSGMAKFMYEQTERTKNPVVAFCMFRNASLNKKTGMPQIDDQAVADIVRVLIRWYANAEIQETNDRIEGFKRDLETLKKNENKNKKAIEQGNQKIKNATEYIAHVEEVVSYTNVPSREIVDNFVEDYSDSSREGYKFARMTGSKIIDSYYPGVNVKEINPESLKHNLKQYMGIIFNFFLPPMENLVEFSEANVTELEKLDKKEEKDAEDNSKNQ